MGKLNLPNPKMMDVVVPANLRQALAQDEIARKGLAVTPAQAMGMIGKPDVALVDLRERAEREKVGVIPGSLHAPYPDLQENISAGGMLHELAGATGKKHHLLLRVRRALGDGGAGGAGCRVDDGLPYPRRPRRLAQGQRSVGAIAREFDLQNQTRMAAAKPSINFVAAFCSVPSSAWRAGSANVRSLGPHSGVVATIEFACCGSISTFRGCLCRVRFTSDRVQRVGAART